MAESVVYHKPLRIDGHRFWIRVRKANDGYYGEWHCAACELGGGHTLPVQSVERARIGADANLMIHHELEHIPRLERRRQR